MVREAELEDSRPIITEMQSKGAWLLPTFTRTIYTAFTAR